MAEQWNTRHLGYDPKAAETYRSRIKIDNKRHRPIVGKQELKTSSKDDWLNLPNSNRKGKRVQQTSRTL
jgi:hypothetical protein